MSRIRASRASAFGQTVNGTPPRPSRRGAARGAAVTEADGSGGPRLPESLRDRLLVASSWPWLRALEARAHRGDGEALSELGEALDDVIDTGMLRPDPALAFAFYEASARAGYSLALVYLGFAFLEGSCGQTRDAKRAVALFRRGAALGEPVALGHLGACLVHGRGVRRDVEQGLRLLKRAARLGSIPAIDELAWLYRFSRAIPRTRRSMLHWLRRSAAESPNSAHRLACEYERPSNKARPQPKLAFLAMKRAATWRYRSAMHALGWYYANGFGVRANARLAIHWYTDSANRRPVSSTTGSSMHNLWLLLSQRADAPSQRRARVWLARAAAAGHAASQRLLARLRDR